MDPYYADPWTKVALLVLTLIAIAWVLIASRNESTREEREANR